MRACIPGWCEQLEQISKINDREIKETAVMSDSTRQKIIASSSERGKARQAEVREKYITALRSLGTATSRQLSDALGVTQAAVKTRMLELRRLGLVRDLGSIKQRIYEAV